MAVPILGRERIHELIIAMKCKNPVVVCVKCFLPRKTCHHSKRHDNSQADPDAWQAKPARCQQQNDDRDGSCEDLTSERKVKHKTWGHFSKKEKKSQQTEAYHTVCCVREVRRSVVQTIKDKCKRIDGLRCCNELETQDPREIS